MKDISEKRLSDYMAEQIADEILSGRIPGGSQLKQEELAEAFEASRIPIREAFQILENQGLIIRLATRRITVTELDKEQICLIYSMISEMTKKALNSLKHSGKTAQLFRTLILISSRASSASDTACVSPGFILAFPIWKIGSIVMASPFK